MVKESEVVGDDIQQGTPSLEAPVFLIRDIYMYKYKISKTLRMSRALFNSDSITLRPPRDQEIISLMLLNMRIKPGVYVTKRG
jgi:hypothetical protein